MTGQIKGISYDSIQEYLNKCANQIPCLYLSSFGYVRNLRTVFNIPKEIPDDAIIYKFGYTISFSEITNRHKQEYKELGDAIFLELVNFTYINPLYLSKAGNELSMYLNKYEIQYKNYSELVAIPKNEYKNVEELYKKLGEKYNGQNTNIKNLNTQPEQQISYIKLEHANIISNMEHKYDLELLKKDIENNDVIKNLEFRLVQLELEKQFLVGGLEKTQKKLDMMIEKYDALIAKMREIEIYNSKIKTENSFLKNLCANNGIHIQNNGKINNIDINSIT